MCVCVSPAAGATVEKGQDAHVQEGGDGNGAPDCAYLRNSKYLSKANPRVELASHRVVIRRS
jgi:hypothetical protein